MSVFGGPVFCENQKLPGNIPRAIHERFVREDKKSSSNDEQNFVSMVDSDGETHWYNCLTEVI